MLAETLWIGLLASILYAGASGRRRKRPRPVPTNPTYPPQPRHRAFCASYRRSLNQAKWLNEALEGIIRTQSGGCTQAFQLACMDYKRIMKVYSACSVQELN